MNFWKKKKTNHHHHHHHRENVSDNISIGREEKRRERERERLAPRSRSRKKVSTTTTTHPTRPLALAREKKRANFRIRRTKKKKRFPRFAKWEKDAHLAPATSGCRRSRRFSRGFFLDLLVREPFRGRRASRALPFAHCIKSQSVLRQRQPVSLVLILRSPLLSFFLSFVHTNNNSLALFFFCPQCKPSRFCKRRCRSLPLRLLRALECFSRVTQRHRGQETMVCVIRRLKMETLYPIALDFRLFVPNRTFSHIF